MVYYVKRGNAPWRKFRSKALWNGSGPASKYNKLLRSLTSTKKIARRW